MDRASTILGALYARLPVIGTVTLAALLSGAWFASRTPNEYVAEASLMVPNEPPAMSISRESGNVPRGLMVPDKSEELRIGLLGVVTSSAVHLRVYERLKDQPGWENLNYPGLRRNIIGDIGRDSHLLVLAFARTKERAAYLANLFLEELEAELQVLAETGPRHTLEALEVEEPAAWAEYEAAQQELVDFLDGLGSAGVATDLKLLLDERKRTQQDLFDLEVREATTVGQIPVIRRLLSERLVEGETPFVESSRAIVRSDLYERALGDAEAAATELELARLEFRDPHPEIRRLKQKLALAEQEVRDAAAEEYVQGSATSSLDEQTRSLQQQLVEAEIAEASFRPQRELLQSRLTAQAEALAVYPGYTSRETALREKSNLKRSYAEKLTNRRMELTFHLERGIKYTFTDEPYLARAEQAKPVPNTPGILAFSAVGGLVVGLLLALLLELIAKLRLNALY